jgi:hypothetical protein
MPDYRRMYDDKEHLYAYDLPTNQDVVVQIERCTAGELVGEKGRKSKKPMVKFVGKEKKFALNKTNGKSIARMYGKDADDWAGKWIALYVTTTEFDGETRDCIRIRPQVPQLPQSRTNGKGGNSRTAKPAEQPTLTEQSPTRWRSRRLQST